MSVPADTAPQPVITPGGAQIDVDVSQPTAAQLAAPTQAQSDWVNTRVPEALREAEWVKELAKSADPDAELFKQFENQRSVVGRKDLGIQIPGDNAPEAEWKAFWGKLGAPEAADKYEYVAPEAPKGLEQFYQTDEKLLGVMREHALEAGLTQKQFDKVTSGFNKFYIDAVQAAQVEAETYLKTLNDNFNKQYGAKAPVVMQAFDKAVSATPEFAKAWVNAQGPEGKAAMAALFHNFATKYIGEDKLDLSDMGGGAAATTAMTPAGYGDEFEKRFAALRSAEKTKGIHSGEYIAAKKSLAELQAMGKEIFKV